MKLCADARRDYFKRAPIRSKFDSYSPSADVKSIGDDGIVDAQCSMQVIKEDDTYSFALRLKLETAGKKCFRQDRSDPPLDDESEGDCAGMAISE